VPQPRLDTNEYCLRNLLASDISPLNDVEDEDELRQVSRDNLQLLVNRVFALPREVTESGVVVTLPAKETYKLPRVRRLAKASPKTRWEKFAEQKGIMKKKRSRLVWDETTNDWKPRWGHDSQKKSTDVSLGIVEIKPNQDPNIDPFATKSAEKRLHKAKQELRQTRNKMEAQGLKLPVGVPVLETPGRMQGKKQTADELKEVLRRAQISTASFGKFDAATPGEVKQKVKKRKNPPVSVADETTRNLRAATRIVGDAAIASH